MTHRAIFVGLSLMLAFTSLAPAADWTKVRSKNFTIVGDAPEADLRDAAGELEKFREAMRSLLPDLNPNSRPTPTIIIFADQASYSPFKPSGNGLSRDDSIYGYFQTRGDTSYITAVNKKGRGRHSTVFHEYFHFLIRANSDREELPMWLNEGLAEYLETVEFMPDGRVVFGKPASVHSDLLRRQPLLTVETLLETDLAAFGEHDQFWRVRFYAQSWLLVHYIANLPPVDQAAKIARLVRHLTDESSKEEELWSDMRIDQDAMYGRLLAHRYRVRGAEGTFSLRAGPALFEIAAQPIASEAVSGYLGGILYMQGREAEAESYLQRAAAQPTPSAFVLSLLGRLLVRRGKYIEAENALAAALRSDETDATGHFFLAYAISRRFTDQNGVLTEITPTDRDRMRSALKRSIELKPDLIESYRLLAMIDLVSEADRKETAALLEAALTIKPGDEGLELLLAQTLLEAERYAEAQALATMIDGKTADAKTRDSAKQIIAAAREFFAAAERQSEDLRIHFAWARPLVVLRRSWLTSEEVTSVDEDRINTNINRLIPRPKPDEKLIVGQIESIGCKGGKIVYNVRAYDGRIQLTSRDFAGVKLAVLLEGQRTFKIGCDAAPAGQLAAMIVRPPRRLGSNERPELLSLAFVPDNFRLKSLDEIFAYRTVVVYEDRGNKAVAEDEAPARRLRSIRESLRVPANGEDRILGTLEAVECTAAGTIYRVISKDSALRLIAAPGGYSLAWFTPAAAQVSLSCGSHSAEASVIAHFRKTGNMDGELKALEFVPKGLSIEN